MKEWSPSYPRVRSLRATICASPSSRVLVANTRLGTITQIDGRNYRRVRTFSGLGRPVDLALLSRPQVGLVQSRYAVVADARGWVDILDLDVGRIVHRVPVPHPLALALSDSQLW